MGKSWTAAALILLAVGPAALLAADPAIVRGWRQTDSSGTEFLPPQILPAVPRDSLLPSSEAVAPAPGATPETSPSSLAPAAPAVGGGEVVPPDGVGCDSCASQHRCPHLHRLIEFFTYCPLKRGVNCGLCKQYWGPCCQYHGFPPYYMFLWQPCIVGPVPTPAYVGCKGCGRSLPVAADAVPVAGGMESGGSDTAPATESPSLPQNGGGSYGAYNHSFGALPTTSLSAGRGGNDIGSR